MPTFPLTWYAIAALAVVNAITFGLWRHDAHELDQLAHVAAAENQQSKEIIDKQKQVTEDTTNGWKAALDSVRKFNSRRVLPASTEARGVSIAASDADGADPDAIPTPARIAEDCAFTTLTANQLQDWVRKQEEATK